MSFPSVLLVASGRHIGRRFYVPQYVDVPGYIVVPYISNQIRECQEGHPENLDLC